MSQLKELILDEAEQQKAIELMSNDQILAELESYGITQEMIDEVNLAIKETVAIYRGLEEYEQNVN